MELLPNEEYKRLIDEQGRKLGWIANKLGCSYSLVYKHINGIKPMRQEKIEKLHRILMS